MFYFLIYGKIKMKICIGGDLDGQVVITDKTRFNASEVIEGKHSEYLEQKYLICDRVFQFWLHNKLEIWQATEQIRLILHNRNN